KNQGADAPRSPELELSVGLFSWFNRKPDINSDLPKIDLRRRFDLLNRTGQGSMSQVWRARDKSLGRTVCLKLLDKEKTAKFELRFVGLNKPREGAICTALRHKNIVQTFEYGMTTEGGPYLVMELVDGMGLNFLIETKSRQLEGNRVSILAQMADALEYLHQQSFLHRDICPRNVMVTKDGIVKLIDFGLTIPNRPEFCKPGNRTGTPNYLAPEVIRRTNTDLRVDLFALGVTAYEVYTGDLPWEKAQSLQTLLSHMNSAGKNPIEFCPKMDKRTAQFLLKSIERDPRERFQTAADFREAILQLPKA
ncbi:MAG: serine/threonine protein kinase, partial [Gemmataceae bacterium]